MQKQMKHQQQQKNTKPKKGNGNGIKATAKLNGKEAGPSKNFNLLLPVHLQSRKQTV